MARLQELVPGKVLVEMVAPWLSKTSCRHCAAPGCSPCLTLPVAYPKRISKIKGYPKFPLPGLQAGTEIKITLGLPGTWDQLIKKSIKNWKNWLTAAQPHVFGLGN